MDIMTFSGVAMDPLNPRKEQLLIEDIAHALSLISRANGHFPEIHTVAQHCLECCAEAKARGLPERLQMFCLMHDGAEAYLGDFVSPVKHRMPSYNIAEKRLLTMIYEKFAGGLPTKAEEETVEEIDHTLLYFEFLHYMNAECGNPGQGLSSRPVFEERRHREVEEEFLAVYWSLWQSCQ